MKKTFKVSLFLIAAMMIAVLGCNRENISTVSSIGGDIIGGIFGDNIGNNIGDSIANIFGDNTGDNVGDSIGGSIANIFGDIISADIDWITIAEGFVNTAAAESAPTAFQSEEEQAPVITLVKMPADFRSEHHFFTDDQTNETMLFLTTENVENFAYIEIVPTYNGDNFVLLVGEVLFSLNAFTPEMPFAVTASIGSGIPARAIHFEYKGTVKYFFITESGMDGSLQLVEFTPFMG